MGYGPPDSSDEGVDSPVLDPFRTRHDPTTADESLSLSVITAVAAVSGHDPGELQQLYEVVDPDALDRLFAPQQEPSTGLGRGAVEFTLEGCDVTVYWDGEIVVYPPAGQ